jgi:choline dehydrogenase-like flavoprotein
MKKKYDAIIIGTGPGGGAIGYSLAKKGLKVLFIEKGISIDNNSLKSNYAEHYKINNLSWPDILKNSGRDFDFIYDLETKKYPFIGSGAGGSSALYGMAMERFLDADFEQRKETKLNRKSNLPRDGWPIGYSDLLPYYIKAENLYKVRGGEDPLKVKNNDKFEYKPAPKINNSNQELFDLFKEKNLNPYVLPRACDFVDNCIECQGFLCPLDCKKDSYNTCIKPSIKDYGAEILLNTEVIKLLSNGNQITGVECISDNKKIIEYAEIFILAAGAIRTPALLLKSKNGTYLDGLANSSGQVGKNLMRHCIDLFLIKTKEKPPKSGFLKEIALNDFYFFNGDKRLGTFQSFGRLPSAEIILMNIYEDKLKQYPKLKKFTAKISDPFERIIDYIFSYVTPMNTIIEDLPYISNSVSINNDKLPIINYSLQEYEISLIKEFREKISKVLNPLKFILIKQAEDNKRLAHVCGTCRMGFDKNISVVNENCQSFDHSNLYITDASVFPTSGGTNPALTIIANSLRVADQIS